MTRAGGLKHLPVTLHIRGADEAGVLELLHYPCCAIVADLQPALEIRRAGALAVADDLGGFADQCMAPLPSSFSAPPPSRIVRLSIWLTTANATRLGMLALIVPVITFTSGRCVATTRWMPTARESCAMRQTSFSITCPASIIKSASS